MPFASLELQKIAVPCVTLAINCTTPDSKLGDPLFESRPTHKQSWLTFLVYFLSHFTLMSGQYLQISWPEVKQIQQ